MKINDFADAVKNKPNQTQLQTNHPIFKISLKNPCFLTFSSFFVLFSLKLCSVDEANPAQQD